MKPLLLGFLWLWGAIQVHAAEEITLFSYQHKPPYITATSPLQGLYPDLALELSRLLPQYVFVIEEIPRARLDYLLARRKLRGLVIGASPIWFADAGRYQWTVPFIEDANVVVSRLEGTGSKLKIGDLPGRRVGLIGGHHYPALDDMIWRGEIIREDTATEHMNLERLRRGWVDATVIGKQTMNYYLRTEPNLTYSLYIEPEPLSTYQRHIMVPVQYFKMVQELNAAIETLKSDEHWQNRLKHYE